MALVMSKYQLENKTYLVYDKKILDKDFNAMEISLLLNDIKGIGAEELIVISSGVVSYYDKNGYKLEKNTSRHQVIEAYKAGLIKTEVRFTKSYIDSICVGSLRDAHIA